jgi:hypothetical protein
MLCSPHSVIFAKFYAHYSDIYTFLPSFRAKIGIFISIVFRINLCYKIAVFLSQKPNFLVIFLSAALEAANKK